MFSIWSSLNSSLTDQKIFEEHLKKYKEIFKSSLSSYYKPQKPGGNKKDNPNLKKNENELITKFSTHLNLDEESCADIYSLYLSSPFNHFIVSSDLLDKLQVGELFSAHFQQFVDFYYRERYSFLKNMAFIISSITENSFMNFDPIKYQLPHLKALKEMFKSDDLKLFYKSSLKDYGVLCKEIKLFSTKKNLDLTNAENFQQKSLTQLLRELELILEIILVLVNLIVIDGTTFQEILKEFLSHSIIKYLNSSLMQSQAQLSLLIDQITNLHSFIIVKATGLDKITGLSLSKNENNQPLSLEDKTQLLNPNTKAQINELIASFGSNQKASPIILTWATLLYNLSTDSNLNKMFSNETKSLINRMFALSKKENVFMYILDLFATGIFKNQDTVWHIKQIIYEMLNSVMHSFDENSMEENLKTLYEICFFCMDKNEIICENFWELCKLPDRDNLTILISYSIETFPISFVSTLTFFSLISKTNADLCKQIFEYLTRMDQFCEYFENLNSDEYITNGDSIKLVKKRKLFDGYILPAGVKGTILNNSSNANSNIAHRMILQNQAVNWNMTYNCFDLIQYYLNQINYAASQNRLNGETNIIAIIRLVDSLFKYFFDIDDLTENHVYDLYTKYMENFVNSCFTLFSNLIMCESTSSYMLISSLLELFNNISPNIHDKLIPLLQKNHLIGHCSSYDKMNIQELFNKRLSLVKDSSKLLFLFKSQDYELIINYYKLIDSLIKESGNNIEYMSPLCSVLIFTFPEIYKWRNNMLNLNIDLSLSCLNLLHTVLNTSLSPSFNNANFYLAFNSLHSNSLVSIDQFCETVLLNTECSESILNLIYIAYDFSQDVNHLNEIKKLDNILMQSISLINRLIIVPSELSDESSKKSSPITQSILYTLLIKSISQQNQSNSSSGYQSSFENTESNTSNDVINKNNQFLLQLNLMMSQSNPSLSKHLTVLNTTTITDSKNELNWFHLLIKIAIYKSNHSLDCLLFSLFKKISQLTPRLFGSLLGPYTPQMHSVILNKLKKDSDGQIVSTISEFLCSLIENQPRFFQILANLKIETIKSTDTESLFNEKFIEGDKSILKALFDLINYLESRKNEQNNQDYHVSIAGIFSIFFTIWSNRKIDYMNYCRQKNEFWKVLTSSLNIIKKDVNQRQRPFTPKNEDEVDYSEYSEYFGTEYFTQFNNEFSRFDEFILEANIKSVSYAFKIFSLELFELIYFKKLPFESSVLPKMFSDSILDKNLIEKWLDFYSFQLKRDLIDDKDNFIKRLETALVNENLENTIKSNLSVLDPNFLKKSGDRPTNSSEENKKKTKSKMLFDSVKMLLLLINKTNRLVNESYPQLTMKQSPQGGLNTTASANNKLNSNAKLNFFIEKLGMKKIKLDIVLDCLISSMEEMVDHLLFLNNNIMNFQQEQQLIQEYQLQHEQQTKPFFLSSSTQSLASKKLSSKINSAQLDDHNFITLKQSNEIVKQFHSIANTTMILVTSVNVVEQFNSLNPKQLINDLISTLEKLVQDHFNYFPAIINSIQTSLLHLFTLSPSISYEILKDDESVLKRMVLNLCKIFKMSTNNLEDENFSKSSSFKDCINTFILNINLIKFVMNKFEERYWYNEIVECCMIQCLYTLFEKYVQDIENSDLMYSILDMFFTFANNQVEHLAKSDFNTRTCLLVVKLFDYLTFLPESPSKKAKLDKSKSSIKWCDVLKVYINIQTMLLIKLKYKYLKDSILFFGSYFETMVNIVLNLYHSMDISLLEIVRSFSRFLSQMSSYTKELLIHIPNSMDNLERLFCSLIQLCIMKLSHVKMISIKSHHLQQTSLGPQQLNNNQISKINSEELVHLQNLLFSIISISLDSLFNFVPNFGDPNYLAKIDEYKFLLAFQLTPPSSFDTNSLLSFGSILWLIDHVLKILHRYDQISSTANTSNSPANMTKQTNIQSTALTPNKRLQDIINGLPSNSSSTDTSPKKNVSIAVDEANVDTKLPFKSLIVAVLEKALNFLLTQIILCDRQIQFSPRDKKLFKRELNSEINTIIQGLGRTLKRTTQTSSQYPTKSPTASGSSSNISSVNLQVASSLMSTGSKQTYEFFKCIQHVLQQNVITN